MKWLHGSKATSHTVHNDANLLRYLYQAGSMLCIRHLYGSISLHHAYVIVTQCCASMTKCYQASICSSLLCRHQNYGSVLCTMAQCCGSMAHCMMCIRHQYGSMLWIRHQYVSMVCIRHQFGSMLCIRHYGSSGIATIEAVRQCGSLISNVLKLCKHCLISL